MDKNEIIALSIVVLAVLLAARYFWGKKGGGCCGSNCLTKLDKKDDAPKMENKK